MMPEPVQNFIRYYGASQHQGFSDFISQSLTFFQQQQDQFQGRRLHAALLGLLNLDVFVAHESSLPDTTSPRLCQPRCWR